MGKISTYNIDANVTIADKLIGSDAESSNETKNFLIGDILSLPFPNVPVYANNAAALVGGLVIGNIYRITGTDQVGIVH
jgi:hypothetical protein